MIRILALAALVLIQPVSAFAEKSTTATSKSSTAKAEAEVREAIRQYDDALRRADAASAERFWAKEYTFINPRGEILTRADRVANVQTGKTAFDSLAHVPEEDMIRIIGKGDIALYTTLLAIHGRYSGQGQEGAYRGLVVWTRREGRWQQIASQLTPVVAR